MQVAHFLRGKLIVQRFHVSLKVLLPFIGCSTDATREWSLHRVLDHVNPHILSLSGRIRTQTALERPLPRVNPHMLSNVTSGVTRVRAQVTPVNTFPSTLPREQL